MTARIYCEACAVVYRLPPACTPADIAAWMRLHTGRVHDDDRAVWGTPTPDWAGEVEVGHDELREARDYVAGERVGWDRLLCRADELVRRVDVLDLPRGPYERGVWRGWEASRRALLRALGRMRSVTPDGYVERAVGATRATESLDPLPPPENEENEEKP